MSKTKILRYWKLWFLNFTLQTFNFNFYKKNITTSQNYLSFPSGNSFLKQMLFHSLYKVSIGSGGTVFSYNDVGGTCLNGGQKEFKGGRGWSTMDDAMPSSPSFALFFCVLTYSFLSNASLLTIVILNCLDLQVLSC